MFQPEVEVALRAHVWDAHDRTECDGENAHTGKNSNVPYLLMSLSDFLGEVNQFWYRTQFGSNSLLDDSISDSICCQRHLAAWDENKNRRAAPQCWKSNGHAAACRLPRHDFRNDFQYKSLKPTPTKLRSLIFSWTTHQIGVSSTPCTWSMEWSQFQIKWA